MGFRYVLSIPFPGNRKPTGVFGKFVNGIFKKDKDSKREFRKMVGLAMSNIRCLNTAFMFYGISGTGKTSMMNLLAMLFEPECISALSFSQITNESTIAETIGKHINFTSSVAGMGGRSNKCQEIFQSLVGNDTISVKCRDGVHYNIRNRCLMVFACGSVPDIQDIQMVESMAARIIIFPFQHINARENWKMDVWENAYEDVAGIVKFAIKGIKDLEEDNYVFEESDAMMLAKEEFFGHLESFSGFAKRYLTKSKNNRLASEVIKRTYEEYCLIKDFPALHENQWPRLLKKLFHCPPCYTTLDGRTVRGYEGIDLTAEGYSLLGIEVEADDDYNNQIQTALQERMDLEAEEGTSDKVVDEME